MQFKQGRKRGRGVTREPLELEGANCGFKLLQGQINLLKYSPFLKFTNYFTPVI